MFDLPQLDMQKAAALSRVLHDKAAEFLGGQMDARIVALACAGAAGSVVFELPEATKRELAEAYVIAFRTFADVPDVRQ